MARRDAAIAEWAEQQLGLITKQQLEELGCNDDMRRGRIDRGSLVRISRSVYAIGGLPPDWKRDLLAATWAAGPSAVASHRSAARLWEFEGVGPAPNDVSVEATTRRAQSKARLWRSLDLVPTDTTEIGPIPVTTKVRTLVDLGAAVSTWTLESAVDGALRDGLVDEAALVERAKALRRRGRSGPGRLLAVLGAEDRRTESWLERRLVALLDSADLPPFATQVVVATPNGSARVDVLFEAQRLVIEADGHRTHSTRQQLQADNERQAGLMAAGYRVVRFTFEDVTRRPEHVVSTVRALLDSPNFGAKVGSEPSSGPKFGF